MPSVERTAARVALAGIAASAVLASLKTGVGLAAHSVATVSDGLESAADVISSGLVYLGLRIAAKPARPSQSFIRADPVSAGSRLNSRD